MFLPTIRAEILKILLKDEELAPNVDLKFLATKTESFSGSDLKRQSASSFIPIFITT